MVNFIATELHKAFSPLFSPDAGDDSKDYARKMIAKKLDHVERELGAGPFLMGETLTLPDAYLFVITGWTDKLIGLDRWPNLQAFRDRMMERDSVRQVLRLEGLLQEEPAG